MINRILESKVKALVGTQKAIISATGAFEKAYPHATFEVITPKNADTFLL